MRLLAFFIILLATNLSAKAQTTWNVPNDFPTIQLAIDASTDRDEIVVHPGTYVENIDFLGKSIKLSSIRGPDITVIDGSKQSSVVIFDDSEGRDSILDGFTLTNGLGKYHLYTNMGGGILCVDSSPTILNNAIIDNVGYYGGGICCYGSASEPLIQDCRITGNQAPLDPNGGAGRGGGIFCRGGASAHITGCTIQGNMCVDRGGGISADGICSPVIEGNLIDGNIAQSQGSGFGGGIGTLNGVSPVVRGNTIVNNLSCVGGGVSIWGGEVSNNIIMYNTAKHESGLYGAGGGIQILASLPITVKNNYIAYNTCMLWGGGIIWGAADGELASNIICNNIAAGGTYPGPKMGGGIYVEVFYGKLSNFTNNLIYENYSEDYGGGVCLSKITDLTITHTTIAKNTSSQGAGIYCMDSSGSTIINSIVWDNLGPQMEHEQFIPTVTYSDIQGGWQGTGNIDLNPCFADAANNDFHLHYDSPCRNTGDNNASNLPVIDFEGDPRIAHGTVDMGADEFYPHLDYTGDATPTGSVLAKFVGLPGTTINGVILGFNILAPPLSCDYGLWYMDNPFQIITGLGALPPEGVAVFPGTIPATPPAPYTIYLQGVINMELTNLCPVQVK